jgi:hypothetical protein
LRIDREDIHENKIVSSNTMQITLDDDFNVPDSKPDIAAIVKERGNVLIDSVKVTSDRAQITGRMDFAILYIGTGDRKNPVKMSGNMNINENMNLSVDCDNTYVSCSAKLEDITVKMIHSRKISVKAIVTLTVLCEEIKDTAIGCGLLEMRDEDRIQTKTGEIEYSQLAVSMRDNLRIRENFAIPQEKPEAAEILWEDIEVRSFNTRLTDNGMDITGEMNVFILYQTLEENGIFQWYENVVSFSGKLDISGCSQDMISYVKHSVISSNVEVKPDYDGENRELQVELVLDMDVKAYEDRRKTVLEDVYSPVKDVKNTLAQTQIRNLVMRNNSKCRAVERVKTGEYVNILQICNCTGTAQIDDISEEDDGLQVDGAVIVNVFYVTEDDGTPMGSIRAAIPFSNKIQINKDGKNALEYVVNAYVEQLNAVMTGSNEMEIKANVSLDAVCFENKQLESVMECEVGDYDENEYLKFPGMVGYIASGDENLWDIAKKYHTTVESIKLRNTSLSERKSDRVKRSDKLLLVKAAK